MAQHPEDHPERSATADDRTPWSVYREDLPLRSARRTSLTEAFAHYMALKSGISAVEIADAFTADGDADEREAIVREIRFIAGVLVDGRIATYSRPFGGGIPVKLPASAWEIDDPVPRFSTGTIDPEHPHDESAPATHRILVDSAQWDEAMEGLRGSLIERLEDWASSDGEIPERSGIAVVDHAAAAPAKDPTRSEAPREPEAPWRNDILGIDRVTEATGLARSTIYAKVGAGTFPKQLQVHGARKGWRRGDVQDWLEALTTS